MKYSFSVVEHQKEWDAFVLAHSPEALFQSWSWGEVQRREDMPPVRIGMYSGSELAGTAQVTIVRARRGTFLHVRHGPVLASPAKQTLGAFVAELTRMARRERALFIRMNPLLPNDGKSNALLASVGGRPAAIHAMDAELCWVLDLDHTEEELLAAMRKTTRYEIKRAQKMGVEITVSDTPDDLPAFFSLYEKTAERHKFVGHKGIEDEFNVFAPAGLALLYVARFEKEVIASAIVEFWGGQAMYRHGASVPSKVPASYLIQWEAIREAKKRGLKVYNFWGIAPEGSPNHPWRGISLFKIGFGGRTIEYIHAHDIPLSPLYAVPRAIEQVRKWRKGY